MKSPTKPNQRVLSQAIAAHGLTSEEVLPMVQSIARRPAQRPKANCSLHFPDERSALYKAHEQFIEKWLTVWKLRLQCSLDDLVDELQHGRPRRINAADRRFLRELGVKA